MIIGRSNKLTTKTIRSRQRFILEDFTIKDTLGTGTFGRVRLAECERDNQYYALKVMKKSNVIQLKQVTHINSEVEILSKIHHPFIVNLNNYFQDNLNLFVVLEFVQGGELYTYLRKQVRFSNDHARFYAMEIVLCFEYLHKMNIVYRDLKPENLLLTIDGHIKITDFGFAKQLNNTGLTFTLCGTPEYLAPEIIQSQGHGCSVDWWTLGILLFEMLAGYPPFHDENPLGTYSKILTSKLDFPRGGVIKSQANTVIKKLLKRDLTKRLGCTKSKAPGVKAQKWFDEASYWDELVEPNCRHVPYIPEVVDSSDTTYFDEYSSSEDEEEESSLCDEDQNLFQNWS